MDLINVAVITVCEPRGPIRRVCVSKEMPVVNLLALGSAIKRQYILDPGPWLLSESRTAVPLEG